MRAAVTARSIDAGVCAATSRAQPRARSARAADAGALVVSAGALVHAPIGVLTLFRARRLYAACARRLSLTVLRLYGIRVVVHSAPSCPLRPDGLRLEPHVDARPVRPRRARAARTAGSSSAASCASSCRSAIISWMMGTFFTVPQNRPAERTRIFARAERVLRRTGESVYLSPEGGRITTGEIGHFNKGAFHLATNLQVPIVPSLHPTSPRRSIQGSGTTHGQEPWTSSCSQPSTRPAGPSTT